jgi:hypothetical protein
VQRLQFDLRWQVALNLPTDYPGFDPTSLGNFRERLAEHGKERYAFDRFVAAGRAAGFIPDRVTLLTDTTRTKGAGAVQDTYTLLRKCLRKLLKQLGYPTVGQRHGLAPHIERLLATYLDHDRKAKSDWANPAEQAQQLKVLFQNAEAVLKLAGEHSDDAEVRATGWLLVKIMGDDIESDEHGAPQIAEGTAPDRVISVTDPEMRHGHKSKRQRFNGFKVSVTTELILDIQDIPATGSDGQPLLPTIARAEEHAGVRVAQVIGDGAYGSGENRAACADRQVDLLAPIMQPAVPTVDKSAFQIDLAQQTATCPQGHTVAGKSGPREQGQPTLQFTFARATCEACPLFQRCVKSKTAGRTVATHPYERHLRAARRRQQTGEFQERYRLRSAIERNQAELVRHGVRQTRYLGHLKRQLQHLWTAAVVNLKRLFRLCDLGGQDLRAVLTAHPPQLAAA